MIGYINGVNLLPATGEFTYDPIPYLGQRATETRLASINRYANGGPLSGTGTTTDYSLAIDNLLAEAPGCTSVALVVAWFGSSTDVTACQIYPSTTYINGTFQQASGAADVWRCSGLTQSSPGLIALPQNGASFIYGGTPADQSIVRCIQDLKARGLRVVFYPLVLMTDAGKSWRGEITYPSADISGAATAAIAAFLGSAAPPKFTRDTENLTVGYSGAQTDFTFRRMILHYANLCVVAGGVDLFLLGSEFRGLEIVRGPAWTKGGVTGADGKATWDYPFVAGLMQLADDVRGIFDGAGLTKDVPGLHNLVSYSADWSVWMGVQHAGENGQWPHLDQLYAHDNIDIVCFDNYLPLSDWTTGGGGLDALNWSALAPSTWPPDAAGMNGLGLTGSPTIYSLDYLKANIEGGEKFNWFYSDSDNGGVGLDPNGTDLRVSLPQGDRLSQNRELYAAGQQLLANKQLRWWWNNSHQAIYDAGDGNGWAPHGASSEWVPQSKSITFAEYGCPAADRGSNQPNVFYDPAAGASATPYWSIWDASAAGGFTPRRDDEIQLLALQAIYEYWVTDGNNDTSAAGVRMIEPAFMSVWNWDARPFPTYPRRSDVWGDTGNWATGLWLGGKGPFIAPLAPDPSPLPASYPAFPALGGQGWAIHYRPDFTTDVAQHVSGRESRATKMSAPLWQIELTFDVLRADIARDLQRIAGFFASLAGQNGAFTFPVPAELDLGSALTCRFADDQQDLEEFMSELWSLRSLKLKTVKG